ncbi:hypothetical protein JEZ13_04360 [bacterium]|nr:hypothetical protein [bacterium]
MGLAAAEAVPIWEPVTGQITVGQDQLVLAFLVVQELVVHILVMQEFPLTHSVERVVLSPGLALAVLEIREELDHLQILTAQMAQAAC